ncbi:hypothetical protein WISP_28378 [Willisornis vidua]|uniref:Uncharacterized protein n=1 Tax=Willisornis vidua TaxID=1566151 RepID=A0ABQ9DRQ9_9PASS|nr:hypothetical protein WISP_28378 [Willisornis vidua]
MDWLGKAEPVDITGINSVIADCPGGSVRERTAQVRRIEALLRESAQLHPAAQRSRYPTPALHGSSESKRESKPLSSSNRHADTDQRDKPEFWLLSAQGGRSSSMKPKRDNTWFSTHMSSQVTPDRAGTGSAIHSASSVTSDRVGTGPSMDKSSGTMQNRTSPVTPA